MAEIVQTAPIVAEQSANSFGIFHLLMLLLMVIVVVVIWKANKAAKVKDNKKQRYENTYKMVTQMALQSADDRYFKSWWFPSKNAPIYRMFEWLETDKIKMEPLISADTRYMGHFVDFAGFYNFAFFSGRKFLILPVVEIVQVKDTLVHMQDDMIVINCVSVDRKTEDTPYFPVVKMKDGTIANAGFTLLDKFFDEKVSAQVITEHGNNFMNHMEKAVKINPNVVSKNKTYGSDGGR